jgi:hypothetical protein
MEGKSCLTALQTAGKEIDGSEKTNHEVHASNLFDDGIVCGDVPTNSASSPSECLLSNMIVFIRMLQVLEVVITHQIVLCGRRS